MRIIVRIAVWLSVVAVLVIVVLSVSAVDQLNEPWWGGEPGDVSLWWGVLLGLVYSGFVLAFIWLGVFVAYVVSMAVRALR
jgi:hypothetical protein